MELIVRMVLSMRRCRPLVLGLDDGQRLSPIDAIEEVDCGEVRCVAQRTQISRKVLALLLACAHVHVIEKSMRTSEKQNGKEYAPSNHGLNANWERRSAGNLVAAHESSSIKLCALRKRQL
jgi:hypothetical protein